jgi:hypothetical protein
MSGILRIAVAALLVGAVAIAPVSAGVPVPLVPLLDSPVQADESAAEPFDRPTRSVAVAARRSPPPCGRPSRLNGSAPLAPSAGWPPTVPFDSPVRTHVRLCVWRE